MSTITLTNPSLIDIGNAISNYSAKNPILEKFWTLYRQTLYILSTTDEKAYRAFDEASFYKVSQVRGYIEAVSPLRLKFKKINPKDGDKIFCHGFCGRSGYVKYSEALTRACILYLMLHYEDDFEKQLYRLQKLNDRELRQIKKEAMVS